MWSVLSEGNKGQGHPEALNKNSDRTENYMRRVKRGYFS